MSMLSRTTSVLIATVAIGMSLLQTASAQQVVTIDNSGFNPNSLTISIGDSVLWYNFDQASAHTTTSDLPVGNPDYWNVSLNYSQFYTRTFVRSGTFAYHDNMTGHSGTIIVTSPAVPQLDAPRILNGQFVFTATGLTTGKTNVLQSSTNLTTWVARQTNTAASSSMNFTNPVSGARDFFRLVELH